MNPVLIAFVPTISVVLINVVAIALAFGILKTKVEKLEEDFKYLRSKLDLMSAQLPPPDRRRGNGNSVDS